MAKILVKVPEPKTEYDFSNQKQISRAISAIVEQLNSTFLQQQIAKKLSKKSAKKLMIFKNATTDWKNFPKKMNFFQKNYVFFFNHFYNVTEF